VYDLFGDIIKRLDMKEKLGGSPILDARVWGTGFVVLTRTLEVVASYGYDKPTFSRLQLPGKISFFFLLEGEIDQR
jgi:hypothetical protein